MPREQYDPGRWTLAEREQAKADELTALGFGRISRATVQRMRLAYRRQGLWGLVDHRTTRAPSRTGRTDERVVAAVNEALRRQRGRSKGTIGALIPLIGHVLEDRYGREAVPLPSRATLYRLIRALARPGDLPGSPARSPGPHDDGHAMVRTLALRPGEQVQIDTTRLDILARFDDGTLGRPELTIAVDVATRAILAAVLRPGGTKAVDAALLLAEMAVPHPARPTWPQALREAHTRLPNFQRLLALDDRLRGAAARPVAIPETIVIDRGKVFVSEAFTAACETLGISVQPTPPYTPTAKAIVERTFGTINVLLCQYVAGYTGPDTTRRGPAAEREACWSVAQLQDLLDEWLIHYHHRPHAGLRHPTLPKLSLSPNQMWSALVAVAGYVPVPLTGEDYLELLPVRWHAITDRGISINNRTYDHDLLGPHRGQPSEIAARRGRWEVHHNPHDVRQIWVRLPGRGLTEIPWIHRDHSHHPFNDRTWHYIQTITTHPGDRDQYEAHLADALDHLMRRARAGQATRAEQALLNRTAPARIPPPTPSHHHDQQRPGQQQPRRHQPDREQPDPEQPGLERPDPEQPEQQTDRQRPNQERPELERPEQLIPQQPAAAWTRWETTDSIDDFDDLPDDDNPADDDPGDDNPGAALPYTGLGLYDAEQEADKW